jgi:hypothetical protein
MTVPELIEKVNDGSLDKEQLEKYQTQVSYLFQRMMVEIADIEKAEALFMGEKGTESVAQRKLEWKATSKGQREIELKRWSLALKEMLNSLKSRIYQLIY